MTKPEIVNIPEFINPDHGVSYKGEITVYIPPTGRNFCFFQGRHIYLHAYTYFIVREGEAAFSADGTEYKVDRNTMGIVSPLHLIGFGKVSDNFSCIFLSVSKTFIDGIPVNAVKNRIVQGLKMHNRPVFEISDMENELLTECMLRLKNDMSREGHLFRNELIQNSLIRYYIELDNIFQVKDIDITQARYGNLLKEFIGLLMDNYKLRRTVPYYAEKLNITPQYLSSIIKAQTGHTVNDFAYQMLYSEARKLLADSEMSIQQIADELNFSDQSSFTKFFRRQSGCSPSGFRKKLQKK